MGRNAGFYVAGKVQIIIGTPVGPLAVPVAIPGLPEGVGFPFVMSGRPADEFASADRNTDSVTLEVGTDGEGVFNITFDKSGTMTITVMETSFLNIALSLAHTAMTNEVAPLLFTLPVKYNDPFAISKNVIASNCVIQRPPPMTFGATAGTNAWVLLAHQVEINHGARIF